MPLQRVTEIRRRRLRRERLAKLRIKYRGAKTETARKALREKAFKISPNATLDE